MELPYLCIINTGSLMSLHFLLLYGVVTAELLLLIRTPKCYCWCDFRDILFYWTTARKLLGKNALSQLRSRFLKHSCQVFILMLILRHTCTYIQIAHRLNQSDGSIVKGVVNKGNSKVLSSISGSHKVAGKGKRVSLTSTCVQQYECLGYINSNNKVNL